MKMELTIYQVDAFARAVFQGNPAAVCPLVEWLPDDILQAIATENNLSETAYFVDRGDHFHLRWFTPAAEVRLCGHATLASAHVLFAHLGFKQPEAVFQTLGGALRVRRDNGRYIMNFPADQIQKVGPMPLINEALGLEPVEIVRGQDDYLARLESADQLWNLKPDLRRIIQLGNCRGLIVTAPGHDTDFASRCFYPALSVDEDPVTGSAHTLLTPYWASLTGKREFEAVQGGRRKGFLQCRLEGDRVHLSGQAQTYLEGKIFF